MQIQFPEKDQKNSQVFGFAYFDIQKFREDVIDFKVRQRITLTQIATACGMHYNTFQYWVRGTTVNLDLQYAAAVAAYCDLSLDSYVRLS